MKFFKPGDFERLLEHQQGLASADANTKLDSETRCMFGTECGVSLSYSKSEHHTIKYTVAILNREFINNCKHEKEKVKYITNAFGGYFCDCGREVKPSGFEDAN